MEARGWIGGAERSACFSGVFCGFSGSAGSAARWSIRSKRCCCCACSLCLPERKTFVDIARFGQKKIELLSPVPCRFVMERRRTTTSATFRDARRYGIPTSLRRLGRQADRRVGDVIAIDGKTLRGSSHKRGGKAAIPHGVRFAARQRLVLGQVKVADKSNEIIAIPALLDMLAIGRRRPSPSTPWAASATRPESPRQEAITSLALKGNQGTLREDVECSPPSRRQTASEDTKSPDMRPSMATMAASRPEPIRLIPMWLGFRNATHARFARRSSWSRASAKSPDQARVPTQSSARRASISLHCCGSPPNSGRLSEPIG